MRTDGRRRSPGRSPRSQRRQLPLCRLVKHHSYLERGGSAGVEGPLWIGSGIQHIRTDGDIQSISVLTGNINGLLDGRLPAIEFYFPGGNHRGPGLPGLDALLMVIPRPRMPMWTILVESKFSSPYRRLKGEQREYKSSPKEAWCPDARQNEAHPPASCGACTVR